MSQTNVGGRLASPAYDASGNVLNDGSNVYLYDAEGRVCAVGVPPAPYMGGPVAYYAYIYDAEGRRVAKGTITTLSCNMSSNGFTLTNSYALDQEGHQVTETTGTAGVWLHSNVYAGDQLLATYDNGGVHFHIDDWLGSRRVQANFQGQMDLSFTNLPFGEMSSNNQLGATEQHFTGKERDAESGLDNFDARYFGSSMGRFMSPDPSGLTFADLGNPQSLNLYIYVLNNPLTNVDPTGLDCVHINNDTGAYEGFESGDCDNSTEEKANSGYYIDGTVNQISMNSQGQVLGYSTSTADGYFPGTPGASSTAGTAVNLNPCSGALSNSNQSVNVTANPTGTSVMVNGANISPLIPSASLHTPNPNVTHYVSAQPPVQPVPRPSLGACIFAPDAVNDIHNLQKGMASGSPSNSTDGVNGVGPSAVWSHH